MKVGQVYQTFNIGLFSNKANLLIKSTMGTKTIQLFIEKKVLLYSVNYENVLINAYYNREAVVVGSTRSQQAHNRRTPDSSAAENSRSRVSPAHFESRSLFHVAFRGSGN